jgi:hypothetical protein
MPRFSAVVIAVSALLLAPARVAAQDEEPPLSGLLPRLYVRAIFGEYNAFVDVFAQNGLPLDEQALLRRALERAAFASQVIYLAGNQLSSFPLPSASGGFTWNFDSGSATFTRTSNSFGPIYAERPLTIGRKRLNVGANYQHVTFDRLEGRSLRGGEIVGYLGVRVPEFDNEGVFFADSLDVSVTTDTLNAFATYGVTDRFDVGVAVPINRVALNATLASRVGNTLTGISDNEPLVTSDSGTASGIGDMVIRAKFNVLNRRAWAIGESVEVRLPTGDERELLGVAGPQVKLTFIASSVARTLAPHANLSYTISGTSRVADAAVQQSPPEEVGYAVGADWALSLRTTVAFDAVGRTLRKAGTLSWVPSEFGAEFPHFTLNERQDLHLLLGSIGLKINPFANMLITTNVLFPLTKSGLTDNLTWMAGVDYSF